jgi:hypothetical protein
VEGDFFSAPLLIVSKVFEHAIQHVRIIMHLAEHLVASRTQNTSELSRSVIMIDMQAPVSIDNLRLLLATYRARSKLVMQRIQVQLASDAELLQAMVARPFSVANLAVLERLVKHRRIALPAPANSIFHGFLTSIIT